MTSDDLYKLYKLHQVDAKIVELKRKAAAFDPTKESKEKIEALKPAWDAAKKHLESLEADALDLELKFKTVFDRLTYQVNYLHGGKITNPREVELIEKDVENLRERAEKVDADRGALVEQIPVARAEFKTQDTEMEVLKKEYAIAYKKAVKERETLQADYAAAVKDREAKAKAVLPSLLAQYDAIRAKSNGIGMAEVVKDKNCGGCGTVLPARLIVASKESKLVTCESCHRILFTVVPNA